MKTEFIERYRSIRKLVTVNDGWRLIPSMFEAKPLGIGFGDSRFSAPNDEFKILYMASSIETALRETIIRDSFDNKSERFLERDLFGNFCCIAISSTRQLNLIDLTDGNASNVGLPSGIRHDKNYVDSKRFSLFVYRNLNEVDGFYYRSRFDDQFCFAVFDRAVDLKLEVCRSLSARNNGEVIHALESMGIVITRSNYEFLDGDIA